MPFIIFILIAWFFIGTYPLASAIVIFLTILLFIGFLLVKVPSHSSRPVQTQPKAKAKSNINEWRMRRRVMRMGRRWMKGGRSYKRYW